ncbi:hypothetical protein QYE76_029099 [Lolium multiflorum]|uniref:CCHC-type domain-containing protein n=1 Tax=Lolium multiflorum TaxID=4521 RepID=A0AAD8QNJ4_LOLMU|nr:hypothetical protein QYE76_029099 [Lolium multiflorum]
MTVRLRSGDAEGDAGDALATLTPATERRTFSDGSTPEYPLGGRFWVLSSSDEESEDDVAMDAESATEAGSLRYLCRTPEEVGDRDLNGSIQDLARRSIKRLHRRQMQRKAAMDFLELEGVVSTMAGVDINLAVVELVVPCEAELDQEPAVEVKVSMAAVAIKAVVAAVTAVQKGTEASNVAGSSGAADAQSVPAVVSTAGATVVEPLAGQGNAKDMEGAGPAKKKKEDKEACFRCKKPGHYIDDCTTPYCDICESVHHVSSACHLLQAPKPTAILHGYANEALMFFEMPCGAFKSKVENPKLAKVSVEGEVLTIPEIIEHMKRIVPYDKFHWEVFHYKDNIYRVKLPSKNEVQRLKNFGSYVCPQKDTVLFFDFWSSVEEPLYLLPEVWVRVDGVPSDMRSDYLSLWGIGSLFGKTLDVDMPFTRKNKLLRIKIGCLDRNLIPADSDVFIRKGFYKLRFEVEPGHVTQEVNMVEATNHKDGGGDPSNGLGDIHEHNDMDMDARGGENETIGNKDGQLGNATRNGVEGMQEHNEQVDAIEIGTLKDAWGPRRDAVSRQRCCPAKWLLKGASDGGGIHSRVATCPEADRCCCQVSNRASDSQWQAGDSARRDCRWQWSQWQWSLWAQWPDRILCGHAFGFKQVDLATTATEDHPESSCCVTCWSWGLQQSFANDERICTFLRWIG